MWDEVCKKILQKKKKKVNSKNQKKVPMIWTACYLLWVLLQEHNYDSNLNTGAIISYCVLATYLTSRSKGTTQFYLFQST
jgi:dihydroceramidase